MSLLALASGVAALLGALAGYRSGALGWAVLAIVCFAVTLALAGPIGIAVGSLFFSAAAGVVLAARYLGVVAPKRKEHIQCPSVSGNHSQSDPVGSKGR